MSFYCNHCGYISFKWMGKCPVCHTWNNFLKKEIENISSTNDTLKLSELPIPINLIKIDKFERLKSGFCEIDRVLGGGIVPGSAILVGGDPGIGKSTLLLQILAQLAEQKLQVLYITGEESAVQIKLRAERLGISSKNILIMVEIIVENILQEIRKILPKLIVIDSIQTIYSSLIPSSPGSVGQIKEVTEYLVVESKKSSIPIFLIGHVTKDGLIAGPKILEHMVDVVLYFEGDSGFSYRIIRSIKNRYGPTNEIGIFEMMNIGLKEVKNPSEFFLSERLENIPGNIVVSCIEGTRPILIEIQSLVNKSNSKISKRTTMGIDQNRVTLIVAVLDKICNLNLYQYDIYIKIAGGFKINEPAIDLGLAASLFSSLTNRPINFQTVVFGEIGLTGEIRHINQLELRIKEAVRMGFKKCIIPATNKLNFFKIENFHLIQVRNIQELLINLF